MWREGLESEIENLVLKSGEAVASPLRHLTVAGGGEMRLQIHRLLR